MPTETKIANYLDKQHGITHIVNLVSDDVDNQFPDSITYLDVPCAATIDDPIDQHFEKVSKFILAVKEAEGKVHTLPSSIRTNAMNQSCQRLIRFHHT